MRTVSDAKHPEAVIGNNVTVPIPGVDKAKGSLRNVIAIVLDVKDSLYRLGTKDRILTKMYSRSDFDVLKEPFISVDEVNQEKKITLRTAATFTAGGCVQGFIRCQCKKKLLHKPVPLQEERYFM